MEDRVRRILEEAGGARVSGRRIGLALGMSRAAVWKRIEELRRRGFGIEGARGAGYRLLGLPDLLDREEVVSRLASPSPWKEFLFFPVIDSTNSKALEAAEEGAPHGTVVCADAQTRGRGRMGRRWHSPPGLNLYASLLLRPPVSPAAAASLALVAGVALARAVEREAGLEAGLKWPNDLLIGGRKAAGILAEMSSDPDGVRYVVIGVGLNVNARRSAFPPDLRARATSLRIEAGRSFRRAPLLAAFLDAFAACYGVFLSEGFAALLPEWRRRDVLAGQRVTLRVGEALREGIAEGVDGNGYLLFRPARSARAERVASGEIVAAGR